MSYLTIHPDYRAILANAGLNRAEDILRLRAVVFCGHPGRNVSRAQIDTPDGPVRVLIKREHHVAFKERALNLVDGFGLASRSRREALTISELRSAGIAAPDWIAHGEDDGGCAFLILPEFTDAVDLRTYLRCISSSAERTSMVARLGHEIAAIHEAGFDHPDLYAKHILIRTNGTPLFIDWQRTARRSKVGWRARIRALARLNATLGLPLASKHARFRFLAAYWKTCGSTNKPRLRSLVHAIERSTHTIKNRRRVRELVHAQPRINGPELIWLDGEALCVTPHLETCLGGQLPSWMVLDNLPAEPAYFTTRQLVKAPVLGQAVLTRRGQQSWSIAMRRAAGRQRPTSPELRVAGVIYRLEQLALPVAPVLAFGQRFSSPGRLESFLLQSRPEGVRNTRDEVSDGSRLARDPASRWRLLREAGRTLRALHRANFYLAPTCAEPLDEVFAIQGLTASTERVIIDRPDLVVSRRKASHQHVEQDFRRLAKTLSGRSLTRSERMRFFLAYCGVTKAGQVEREIWRRISRMKTVATLAARVFGLLLT